MAATGVQFRIRSLSSRDPEIAFEVDFAKAGDERDEDGSVDGEGDCDGSCD